VIKYNIGIYEVKSGRDEKREKPDALYQNIKNLKK